MTLEVMKEKGTPLDKHQFTSRELVRAPTSKLDDMKTEFEAALADEERHLLNVRSWLSECVLDSAEV